MDEDGEVKRFTYEGWEIHISLSAAPVEGQTAGHADLLRDGEHKCRVALSGRFQDADCACEALERKAKDWIDDWRSRDHTGETGLADV